MRARTQEAGGDAVGSTRAASCAFMGRLDRLTSAIYPHEIAEDLQDDSKDAPSFAPNSWASLLPVLAGLWRLTVHLLRPYVAVGLLVMSGLGVASAYCAAAGLGLLAYLCVWNESFRIDVLGHYPILPPGLHCHRSPRTDAIVSMVPALQHPHYKGTPWIVGGDMCTIYPFLAFKVPVAAFVRRWLTVDAEDTHKKCGETRSGSGNGEALRDSFSVSGVGVNGNDRDNDCGSDHDNGRNKDQNNQHDIDNGNDQRNDHHSDHDNGHERGSSGGNAAPCKYEEGEEEAVALDIALPEKGLDPAKPFYLVLHGLNGGSAEPYVLDFTLSALKRGCGVCVMITRGCMDTPVRGEKLFHGARTSDVRSTIRVLRRSLPEETPLAMVGYSMGGIIAANYMAVAGEKSGLSCGVSMSGSFDTRMNMTSHHSLRLWQPMLALSLKENFVVKHTKKLLARGIDLSKVESAKNVLEFDTNAVAPYNGYPTVLDYYVDMSAAADGKIAGLRTPLLAVSALDDPIMTAAGSPIEDLEMIEDLFILLTKEGGHVGWPTGWLPTRNNWGWMSSTSQDFCEAVVATASLDGKR